MSVSLSMDEVPEVINLFRKNGLNGNLLFEPDSPFSDTELELLSREMRPFRLERDSEKRILVMSPTSTAYGRVTMRLSRMLDEWTEQEGSGICFGTDAGFTLPDKSVRAADVAWLSRARWYSLPPNDQDGFAKICPDFVVEVRSPTDTIKSQKTKMEMWLRNGARLAWLIDPVDERVWVYQPDQPEVELQGFDRTLSGEPVLPGFTLDLSRLRVGTLS
jgi:Uma2 family endonuclease